jgi:hypothetical protein
MSREVPNQTETQPTPEEIAIAAKILSRLKPGFLPLSLFLETARLTVSSIVEVVPLRKSGDSIQVLLTKRDDDDPNWPGMLHTPGTVVRPTDEEGSYASAFGRILGDELASVELAGEPQHVDSILHKVKRGMEDAKVFFVEVTGEPIMGTFHDITALPENVVDTQIDMIHRAATKFAEGLER